MILKARDSDSDHHVNVDTSEDTKSKRPSASSNLLEIASASAFVAIPVIAIVVGLLSIINSHRISKSDLLLNSPQLDQGSCSQPSFYIDFSATTLTFLASLLSTFAAYIAVPFMFLLSFRIAQSLKQKSNGAAQKLPTPYQTGLLIGVIGGGMGSLWNCICYVTRSRKKRASVFNSELKLAISALACVLTLGLVESCSSK